MITSEQYTENPNAYAPRHGKANHRPPIKEATHADPNQRVTAADDLRRRFEQVKTSCKTVGVPLPDYAETFEQFVAYEKHIDAHTAGERARLIALAEERGLPVSGAFELPRAPNLTAVAKIVIPDHGLVEQNVVWVADKDAKVPECAASWAIGYDSRAECGE